MSTSSKPSSSQPTSAAPLKSTKVFDYTKKKRWGDLVVSETVESVALIVNSSMSVLWCGPAISEALGWRDADLVNSELTEYVHDEDLVRFREDFSNSLISRTWFRTHAQMKVNTATNNWTQPEHVLVDFIGHHEIATIEGGSEIPVIYLYAKSHRPSTGPVDSQAFIDLGLERGLLEYELAQLRSEATPDIVAELASSHITSDGSTSFYTSSNLATRIPSEGEDSGDAKWKHPGQSGPLELSKPMGTVEEELPEEGSKKKKIKKSHPSEQHVCITCGRTDSPEWRKGPLGPKTLCNACGLRWAKQNRKTDDSDVGMNDGDDHSSSSGNSSP